MKKPVFEYSRKWVIEYDQLVLGQILELLYDIEPLRADYTPKRVVFDFCGLSPMGFCSYRGYYEHLCIIPSLFDSTVLNPAKLSNFRTDLMGCIGRYFEGYKGGCYKVDLDTPIWVDREGFCSGTYLFDVEDTGFNVILKTKNGL